MPWVSIVEKKIDGDNENPFLKRLDNAETREEILLNGSNAYVGTTISGEKEFRHLIYSTNDGVALWLRTKDFDIDTLINIAQSMQ